MPRFTFTCTSLSLLAFSAALPAAELVDFVRQVRPILAARCYACHGADKQKSGLRLDVKAAALQGGDSGPALVAGKSADSPLLQRILSSSKSERMPPGGERLPPEEIAVLRAWIDQGAKWPDGVDSAKLVDKRDWWSLKPLARPALPAVEARDAAWVRTPVDRFIVAQLRAQGLAPSPVAERRTLVRRLHFDLIGLPPAPAVVERALHDPSELWYEALVEELLSSPHYGERWARHWLDVVHYGDTHGYDKDKPRPNAWPYRDYVIRAFNEDKPYTRFVQEQLAGDVLFPGTRDGIVALGFLAAGPWDFVGQVELREGTLDKKITRTLDRDDMVATTLNTFASLTVQCARCHDHKFDPIGQEDYYSLQAVFAAVDRADRPYDTSPELVQRRGDLLKQQAAWNAKKQAVDERLRTSVGPELARLDQQLASLNQAPQGGARPEFGYHSRIEPAQDKVKWVQVDLGQAVPLASLVYVGCHDTFNSIGAGFGFPVRYKLEISNDPRFEKDVTVVVDQTQADVPNPGVQPQAATVGGKQARYVRFTATKLAHRSGDYILALAELIALTPDGKNAAAGATVTALDSIEVPVRWRRQNLTDGYYHGVGTVDRSAEIARLQEQRRQLLAQALDAPARQELAGIEQGLAATTAQLAQLPAPGLVYAAATQFPSAGSFTPTNGKPRPVYLLKRGSEQQPGPEVGPGTVRCLPDLPGRFDLAQRPEGERRAALANWLVDRRNPLTWRSIVNRVWHYHFGRGLVETPNDFGRMGSLPTHPELLDWLAVEFRDGGQSLKRMHRLIVTSAVYRQSSAHDEAAAQLDSGNQYLWRMNRLRLEAELVRDAVLTVSGKLNPTQFGPGYQPFGFKNDHSPHYLYDEHDPDQPASQRRSIYRFIVRSVPEPFLETLDCADPSLTVAKRNETLTALQALALLNNKFMVRMAEHFAARVEKEGADMPSRLTAAYRLALARQPTPTELRLLSAFANKHGLANACRLLLNANEFIFVD